MLVSELNSNRLKDNLEVCALRLKVVATLFKLGKLLKV